MYEISHVLGCGDTRECEAQFFCRLEARQDTFGALSFPFLPQILFEVYAITQKNPNSIHVKAPFGLLIPLREMTKVYGTGVYDFKRHRVAEYPVSAEAPSTLEKPGEARPVSSAPSSITLSEIQRDRLTRIAAENWMKTADSGPKKPFSPDLVKEIYHTELTVTGIF